MNKWENQNVTGMHIHFTMDSRVAECYVQQQLGMKCNNNWRNELNREQMDVVDKDLKGLKVLRYELPNGSKRQFKRNGSVEAAKMQKIPDPHQTEEKYFLILTM